MIKKKGRRPKSYYQNLDISNTNIILDSQKQNAIDNSINNLNNDIFKYIGNFKT